MIVGRFQVHDLHEGHLELFRAVRSRHNRVIVFVGVSPTGMTKRNPLDFITRKAMIQAKFPEFTVLPLKDTMTDEAWSENLDSRIKEIVDYGTVTLYGGRDSFVPHYHGRYTPIELNLLSTDHPSGTDIRAQLTNNVIESADFRAGVIYAAMNQRPHTIPCVDIIVMHRAEDGVYVLLGKKKGEPAWRFIGGHAETTTENYEEDARKETMEEAGLDLSALHYVGSCLVPDWRWENEESKIKTAVFIGESMTMAARAGDDIDEIQWVKLQDLSKNMLVETHHPLLKVFLNDIEKQWKEGQRATIQK